MKTQGNRPQGSAGVKGGGVAKDPTSPPKGYRHAPTPRQQMARPDVAAQGRRLEAVTGFWWKRANPSVRRREAMRRMAEAARRPPNFTLSQTFRTPPRLAIT